ncbi:putative Serine carboxypeptidase S28 family protein [Hibiscus syriacus]|uniref:Serine carboxypeptidase S28 family protein n=1 Tax=Hibiscus syriacus TaxID=106335 RepID=A0A6A2ZII0_HIBSY|nr:lysosomal Pro-X carboxypeptidase-like [Hibiscus syriacus]KAE8691821.1 putative Serine carboxypeptidase S28 family protein [Hibiscus syriacus]
MKRSPEFSLQCLQFMVMVLSILFTGTEAGRLDIPRLSPTRGTLIENPEIMSSKAVSDDLQTFYYPQTLDHFNYQPQSYATFEQRYVMNFKHWGGANGSAPILAYLGAEAPLDGDLTVIGFLSDNAIRFNALLVYIEHRYYGKSIPFGSREEAFKNASTLGYFNSAQAIADYAEIIMHIKKKLNAFYSPVIVIGGSYGGMLASWLRLKYPHVALGALASSAPILYFDKITPRGAYFSVVTKDFKEASETCYRTIRNSWSVIDKIASQPHGLSILSSKFKTCKPLKSSSELKNELGNMYATAAQYNQPPRYPVTVVCGGIDGANEKQDILSKIFAGVAAYRVNRSCYINQPTNGSETAVGWRWQTCSEMVIPIGIGKNTMFQEQPFDLNSFIEQCMRLYGVPPRPHWVTSYYGGHDIKLILQRFGSNIIFSNGLRDPYSRGGVLENISESIIAIHTVNGSHCLDILPEKESDPEWLVRQRETEVMIIKRWIAQYYADLKAILIKQ